MVQHPRLQMAFNTHQSTLAKLEGSWRLPPVEVFNLIVAADPSDDPAYGQHKKLYSDWLLRQAGKGLLVLENLAEVTRALRLFAALPQHGDLNRFKTPAALVEAVLTAPRATLGSMMDDPHTLELWQRLDGFPAAPAARVDFALDKLLNTDPSGGRHLPHLLRWLAAPVAPLLPEDLPRVKDSLQLYTQNRQRIMPAGKRDLALCTTATDLAGLVQRFETATVVDTSQRRNAEDLAIYNRLADEVADTPDFRLIHITTKAGAQALGKGTKWCTSWGDGDGKQNHFGTYKDGLLYLRSKHDDSVYQLHFGKWMLNDAQDNAIPDFPAFCKRYPGLMEAMCPHALPGIGKALSKKPHHLPDILELCRHPLYAPAAATAIHTALPKIMEYTGHLTAALNFCEENLNPPTVGNIVSALTWAAKDGYADEVATLLGFCENSQSPCHKQEADKIAAKIISTTPTNAARDMEGCFVMTMLNFCEESPNPLHKPAADKVAQSAIRTTLAVMAQEGSGGEITDMLKFCESSHNPLYKPAADQAAAQAITIGLTEEAKRGWGCAIVPLLNFCESSPNPIHRLAASTIPAELISTALTTAGQNGSIDNIMVLLDFRESDPDSRYKLAADKVAAGAISATLTTAKQNSSTDDLTILLGFCEKSPSPIHQKAARDWQTTQRTRAEPRRLSPAMG